MLANQIENIKECATDFIERVNTKNVNRIKGDLTLTELILIGEMQGKNTEVVKRVMSVGSKMFIDAIALYLIENKLEIKGEKENEERR